MNFTIMNATCAAGEYIVSLNANGTVVCKAIEATRTATLNSEGILLLEIRALLTIMAVIGFIGIWFIRRKKL